MSTPPHVAHPHTLRGPLRSSTAGPRGAVCMAAPPRLGTSLTRFVGPYRALPKTMLTTAVPTTTC
eukprot:4233490-Pyramimonas_sp.AAC.1